MKVNSLQGSYCNALMCENYCQGAIVPENDGDDREWKCEKCGEKRGEEEVISIMEEIHGGGQSAYLSSERERVSKWIYISELSNLLSDTSLWTPDDFEAFLLRHVEKLHPHNGLLISAKSRCDEWCSFWTLLLKFYRA